MLPCSCVAVAQEREHAAKLVFCVSSSVSESYCSMFWRSCLLQWHPASNNTSQIALDEPEWDHLGYLRRSPSPCRLRTCVSNGLQERPQARKELLRFRTCKRVGRALCKRDVCH